MTNYEPREIEKGVPLPETLSSRRKYKLLEMEVGDSFLIPGMKTCSDIGATLRNAALTAGFKFTTRKLPEGVRVWRIE